RALFPYTTLFRSRFECGADVAQHPRAAAVGDDDQRALGNSHLVRFSSASFTVIPAYAGSPHPPAAPAGRLLRHRAARPGSASASPRTTAPAAGRARTRP